MKVGIRCDNRGRRTAYNVTITAINVLKQYSRLSFKKKKKKTEKNNAVRIISYLFELMPYNSGGTVTRKVYDDLQYGIGPVLVAKTIYVYKP